MTLPFFFLFFFCPSGGDQAENYLGQDSSDDSHSGIHGPSLTSDAPFLPDYQDEGECHFLDFTSLYFIAFYPGVLANCHLTQAASGVGSLS